MGGWQDNIFNFFFKCENHTVINSQNVSVHEVKNPSSPKSLPPFSTSLVATTLDEKERRNI